MARYSPQEIKNLIEQTLNKLRENAENWKEFLNRSAYFYKYTFPDQLIITEQKPTATAVATFDFWTKRFNSRINRGAVGIPLLIGENNSETISYVYDIADTDSDYKIWKADIASYDFVQSLKQRFNSKYNDIAEILSDAVYDSIYYSIISNEEYNNIFDVEDKGFIDFCINSITTAISARIGIKAPDNLDFNYIKNLSSDELKRVGYLISENSSSLLRQIEKIVISHQKEIKTPINTEQNQNTPSREQNIIGNAQFRYIPKKRYRKFEKDLALKIADRLTSEEIKFSGKVDNDMVTLTFSGNDIERVEKIIEAEKLNVSGEQIRLDIPNIEKSEKSEISLKDIDKVSDTEKSAQFEQIFDDTTPESKQQIKLYRYGDFYEAFGKDAELAAKILELHITNRNEESMVGMPSHKLNDYLDILRNNNISVTVSEYRREQESDLVFYNMPDDTISIDERNEYGYDDNYLLPVNKNKALEFYDQNLFSVYLLYEDGTERMAETRSDIENFGGIFGIETDEWEKYIIYDLNNLKKAADETELPYSVRLYNGEELDSVVYDGSMTLDDYEKTISSEITEHQEKVKEASTRDISKFIVAEYRNEGKINVIEKLPNDQFYIYFDYNSETDNWSGQAGGYASFAEAEKMLYKFRPKSVKNIALEENEETISSEIMEQHSPETVSNANTKLSVSDLEVGDTIAWKSVANWYRVENIDNESIVLRTIPSPSNFADYTIKVSINDFLKENIINKIEKNHLNVATEQRPLVDLISDDRSVSIVNLDDDQSISRDKFEIGNISFALSLNDDEIYATIPITRNDALIDRLSENLDLHYAKKDYRIVLETNGAINGTSLRLYSHNNEFHTVDKSILSIEEREIIEIITEAAAVKIAEYNAELEKQRNNQSNSAIVQVQAASYSRYDGVICFVMNDKVYVGNNDNYDNEGHYDNTDNSLLYVSDNEKVFAYIRSEGSVLTQEEAITKGVYTEEDYREFE